MSDEQRDELATFCIDNEIQQQKYEWLLDFGRRISFHEKQHHINKVSELREIERKYENQGKVLTDSLKRHNAKIMSVRYLLGTIQTCGTHRDKEIIIRHLCAMLDNLIEHDPIPLSEDYLPF